MLVNGVPVFITKNRRGVLAVMNLEPNEKLSSKSELATLLGKALKEVKNGETFDLDDIFKGTSSLYKWWDIRKIKLTKAVYRIFSV